MNKNDNDTITKQLERFLSEDIRTGDITSSLVPDQNKRIDAVIVAKQSGIILAGIKYAKRIFNMCNCSVRLLRKDGCTLESDQKILQVWGRPYDVLSSERTVLNLLSRMSGIATMTHGYVKEIGKYNKRVGLYSTRKTAPGLRVFDKDAVAIGGGNRHRMSLDEMIMIKDNHLALMGGSVEKIIKRAKGNSDLKRKKIEIEVENKNDAIAAAKFGAQIIMLDNLSPKIIKSIVRRLQELGLRKRVVLEASGGINLKNIGAYAKSGVDMISVGRITNGAPSVDFSLEVSK